MEASAPQRTAKQVRQQLTKDNSRKLAADARRMLEASEDEEPRIVTERARELLKRNYERGQLAGRAEVVDELRGADPRYTLLIVASGMLRSCRVQTESISNSDLALSAYDEAAAILEDVMETLAGGKTEDSDDA